MDPQTRLAYLKALGIDVYARRRSDPADTDPLGAPVEEVGSPLEDLRVAVRQCQRCSLWETRTQTVFGVGDLKARWMFVGEAPGEQEDLRGEPFVGRAGQLLDEMIYALGLRREAVYIANVLKCRPPKNRDPKPAESEACEGYLQSQVRLIAPEMIIAVGRIAAQWLLKTQTPIGQLRGRLHRYQGIPLIVTYHPAYLLRSQTEKRRAWDDLKLALKVQSNPEEFHVPLA